MSSNSRMKFPSKGHFMSLWTCRILFYSFFLLTLSSITYVNSQSPKCFQLSGSSICSAWQGESVVPTPPNTPAYLAYSNEDELNQVLSGQLDNLTQFQKAFGDSYDCKAWDGAGIKFHISYLCASYIAVSASACNKTPKPLCKESCASYLGSVQQIFLNPQECSLTTTPDRVANRTALTSQISGFCNILTVDNGNGCVPYASLESDACNMVSTSIASTYCSASNINDTCCATVPKKSSSNSSNDSSTKLRNIILGVIGGLVLFIALVFLVFYLIKRKRNATDSQDTLDVAQTMEVIYNFVPNLADECYLHVGDLVIVKTFFDDGWGYGFNLATKEEGCFPLACLQNYLKGNSMLPPARASAITMSQERLGTRRSSLYKSEAPQEEKKQYQSYTQSSIYTSGP